LNDSGQAVYEKDVVVKMIDEAYDERFGSMFCRFFDGGKKKERMV